MEKKVENKVLIKGNRMIYIEVAEEVSEDEVFDLLSKIEEALKVVGKEAEVLVNITTNIIIRSSGFRKEIAGRIKNIFEKRGFKKVSLFAPNLATRTIVSFIIAITQLDNMRVFKFEKEALKWLKKP